MDAILEFAKGNWMVVGGTLAAMVGAAYVPYVRTLVFKGVKVLMTEAFLEEVFLGLAKRYVQSTDTKLDDIWYAQLEKSMKK
jgi:hypothetical protein